jgi:DNA-binding NarL/FixJ family response regulator
MTINLSIYDDNQELLSILDTHFTKDKRFHVQNLSNNVDNIILETEKDRPDLILLDVSVANDKLYTILADIKKLLTNTILVIFTGYNDEILINKCLASGADFVLDKGMPINALLDEIDNICQKRKF